MDTFLIGNVRVDVVPPPPPILCHHTRVSRQFLYTVHVVVLLPTALAALPPSLGSGCKV